VRNDSITLKALQVSDSQNPGKKCITIFKGSFTHVGPQGCHDCTIFEIKGPGAAIMIQKLFSDPFTDVRKFLLPLHVTKALLRQVLLAIDCLHEHGMVHGDIHAGNILFSDHAVFSGPEEELSQDPTEAMMHDSSKPQDLMEGRSLAAPRQEVTEASKKPNTRADEGFPAHLFYPQPLGTFVSIGPPLQVQISDLKKGFVEKDQAAKPAAFIGLSSPERFRGNTIDKRLDLWQFGCLMFELITGQPLCHVDSGLISNNGPYSKVEAEDDPFLQGSDWPHSHTFYTAADELIRHYTGDSPELKKAYSMGPMSSLETYFDNYSPRHAHTTELDEIKSILWSIFQFTSAKIPSASDLLNHPWFKEYHDGIESSDTVLESAA